MPNNLFEINIEIDSVPYQSCLRQGTSLISFNTQCGHGDLLPSLWPQWRQRHRRRRRPQRRVAIAVMAMALGARSHPLSPAYPEGGGVRCPQGRQRKDSNRNGGGRGNGQKNGPATTKKNLNRHATNGPPPNGDTSNRNDETTTDDEEEQLRTPPHPQASQQSNATESHYGPK